jgi:CubicO group peptidase (beta-lactamase class C family)
MMARAALAAGLLLTLAGVQAAPRQDQAGQIHALMTRYHQLGQLDGTVLVADHGKVVYRRAFGQANREWQTPNTVDTAYRIASLTKMFTATLVMQLAEQGKLKLDDKIGQYVPELKPAIGQQVTLHQLLNHTSGIVDYANFPGFWERRLGERVPRADFIAIMNHDLEFVPGAQGHYNSSGYTLLGYVIEQVTGKSFGAALDEMILAPMKMTRSGYDAPERLVERKASGYTRVFGAYQPAAPLWMPNIASGGGMFSTVGDFLKWDRALHGERLLSAASKRLMFTPYVKDDVWGDLGYGYGWMIGTRSIGAKARLVHEHGGNGNGFRTLVTRYPDEQRLVVIMLNEGNGNKGPGIYRIKDSITSVLYGQSAPMPKLALDEALAKAIDSGGVSGAVARFDALRAASAAASDPGALNMLGYTYAGKGRYDAGIAVLQLNLRLFPQDANTHDSLGEVFLMSGDKAMAIVHYRKAVEMDPKNTNARDVLNKLGAQ